MPQLFDFTSKAIFDFGWNDVSGVARLWLEKPVAGWLKDHPSVNGVRIDLRDNVRGVTAPVLQVGEGQDFLGLVKLSDYDCPGELHWSGTLPDTALPALLELIRLPLKRLGSFQSGVLSAATFSRSPLIIYMAAELKGRWVLTQANQALTDFLGVEREDLIGADARYAMHHFIHPDDISKLVAAYDLTRTTTGEVNLQYRMRNADGDYVSVTERVVYLPETNNKVCIANLWFHEQDQEDSKYRSQVFDVLQSMTQDINIESGRNFLAHFVRRLDVTISAQQILLCANTQPGWWEVWINVRHSIPEPRFHFREPEFISLNAIGWNMPISDARQQSEFDLLVPDSNYLSVLPIIQEDEPLSVCLLLGSQEPLTERETVNQMLQLFGVRLVREIQQIRIRDAQIEQNRMLGQQTQQLTGMVNLLGMLDTVDDEREFIVAVVRQLISTFQLRHLDVVFWQNGDWLRVEDPKVLAHEWYSRAQLLIDDNLISDLEQCRRKDDLMLLPSRRQCLWPLGQSQAGYLVLVLQFDQGVTDTELLSFSRNALALALKGLIQKQSFRVQAMRDSLTGLGNRSQLHSWMRDQLPEHRQASLLLFDLNRFKEINDSFGHQFGDKLLCEIGPRIFARLGNVDHYLARLGGDEFALFLPGITDVEAYRCAEMLRAALAESYMIDGLRFQVEASIGVAHYPLHGNDGHELLRRADVAMYAAKNSGRNVQRFEDELDNDTPLRIAVLAGLDEALEGGEIWVAYQPLMSTKTGQTGGFEALVRWTHPDYGALSPAEFIPLAEMGEGIRKITDFVLHNSMNYLCEWREHIPELHIAVNISPQVLLDHQFPRNVEEILRLYDLPGDALILELTESTLLVDPVRAVEIINVLGNMGVKVEIDDFGTGYSSLSYLKSLPISALKIDRSFIADILQDTHNEVIVSSTIQMAHSLGLKTVAEGVEDEATLLKMMRLGCDMIQGYYYAKPIPGTDVTRWLIRNK